ncbi:MAG: hypothetical protein H0X61_14515, partial [Acidimicrobiia bacterium]|nr:hypothetical protein [Acidimicrobiia bacterium]
MLAVGGQQRGLVDTELTDRPDAVRVVDQRCAVLDDGVHDRPPTRSELIGELADGAGVLTDLPTRLDPGTAGQHHLRVDMLTGLGPRPRPTQRLAAPPAALRPHQPCRPPEARQIAHVDPHPILRLGTHPAAATERPSRRRLDPDHDLGVVLDHVENPEPRQSQQHLGHPDT